MEHLDDAPQFGIPSEQRRGLGREVVATQVERPQGRKVVLQSGDHRLKDAFGRREIPQRHHTEVAQWTIAQQARGHFGTDDLTTVGGTHESSGTVEGWSEVVAIAFVGLAGVQRHSDVQRDRIEPDLLGKGALNLSRGVESGVGCFERHRKAVPTGREHIARVRVGDAPNDLIVDAESRVHRRWVFLPLGGRSLDVGEQKRHRARGWSRHQVQCRARPPAPSREQRITRAVSLTSDLQSSCRAQRSVL